ncbi:MAG: type II CAAX endopeptidase family protein [Gallionella sp.]
MQIVERTPAEVAIAVGVVVASAVLIAVASSAGGWLLLPVTALLTLAAWLRRIGDGDAAIWIAIVSWASVGVTSAVSLGLVWPIPQLIGLVVAVLVLRRLGIECPVWLRRGTPDRLALILAIASVPSTTVALVAFIASGRTDLEAATEGLSSLPLWVVPLAGIGFVLANPTVEEVLFRGALQTVVAERSGSITAGIVVQGVAFGAIHLNGVPGGPLGMVMAGGWGLVLGVVRHRTNSIRLAWVVHVFANIAIFTTVTGLALRDGIL